MVSIREEIKQKRFSDELAQANINFLFTANYIYNQLSSFLKTYGLASENSTN